MNIDTATPIGKSERLRAIPWQCDLDHSPRFVDSLVRYRVIDGVITVREIVPQMGTDDEGDDDWPWLTEEQVASARIEIDRLIELRGFQFGKLQGLIEIDMARLAEADREQVANLANERTN